MSGEIGKFGPWIPGPSPAQELSQAKPLPLEPQAAKLQELLEEVLQALQAGTWHAPLPPLRPQPGS